MSRHSVSALDEVSTLPHAAITAAVVQPPGRGRGASVAASRCWKSPTSRSRTHSPNDACHTHDDASTRPLRNIRPTRWAVTGPNCSLSSHTYHSALSLLAWPPWPPWLPRLGACSSKVSRAPLALP